MKSFVAFAFFALLAVTSAGVINSASPYFGPSAYAAPGVVAHAGPIIPNASPFVANGSPFAYAAHGSPFAYAARSYANAAPVAYAGAPHGYYV